MRMVSTYTFISRQECNGDALLPAPNLENSRGYITVPSSMSLVGVLWYALVHDYPQYLCELYPTYNIFDLDPRTSPTTRVVSFILSRFGTSGISSSSKDSLSLSLSLALSNNHTRMELSYQVSRDRDFSYSFLYSTIISNTERAHAERRFASRDWSIKRNSWTCTAQKH